MGPRHRPSTASRSSHRRAPVPGARSPAASAAPCARISASSRRTRRASARPGACATAGSSASPTAGRPASSATRSRRSRCSISIPGTRALSLGCYGCNVLCSGCQNWQISHANARNETARLSGALAGRRGRPGQAAQALRAWPSPTTTRWCGSSTCTTCAPPSRRPASTRPSSPPATSARPLWTTSARSSRPSSSTSRPPVPTAGPG